MQQRYLLILSLAGIILTSAGTIDLDNLFNYVNQNIPTYILKDNTPPWNQLNNEGATLGRVLFYDKKLSANHTIACASCHQPQRYFTDGLAQGQGLGVTRRNTPTVLGNAYGPWRFWDGRKDSLWSQALEPIEHVDEHGFSRNQVYDYILSEYRDEYQSVFGKIDDLNADRQTAVFVNVGKALEAYQRRLRFTPSRFDRYVDALGNGEPADENVQLTNPELRGLRLFMGRAACASCHNGPLFSNFEFHNTGAPEPDENSVDLGRYIGIELLRKDEFNCLSRWSDAEPDQCDELTFLKKQGPELVGAFKTPSLRNVAETAPYMRGGQFATLDDVVAHYNDPVPPFYDREQHPNRPHFDILPLGLSNEQLDDLVAFLSTLTSPISASDNWWMPPK